MLNIVNTKHWSEKSKSLVLSGLNFDPYLPGSDFLNKLYLHNWPNLAKSSMPSFRRTAGRVTRYVSADWLDTRCDVRLLMFHIQYSSVLAQRCPMSFRNKKKLRIGTLFFSQQDRGNVCSSPQISVVFDLWVYPISAPKSPLAKASISGWDCSTRSF